MHPSLLPKYRGGDPIFWQYRQGDLEAGVTVHWMDDGIDTGDIVNQAEFDIDPGEPLESAEMKYAGAANSMLLKTLDELEKGKAERKRQCHLPCPQLARIPKPEDFQVDWNKWSLERIWHFLRMGPFIAERSLPPAPGFRQWAVGAMVQGDSAGEPGTISTDDEGSFVNHTVGIIRLKVRTEEAWDSPPVPPQPVPQEAL